MRIGKRFTTLLLSFAMIGTAISCGPTSSTATVAQPVPEQASTPAAGQNPKEAAPRVNPNRRFQLRDLERHPMKIGETTIQVWIMDTEAKRQEGMMFLTNEEVKDLEGMLFVFQEEQPLGFWMENTILPLDLIYIRRDGTVLNVAKGQPFNRENLPSAGDAMYVLELKQGMAERLGIRRGTKLTLPRVKAKE